MKKKIIIGLLILVVISIGVLLTIDRKGPIDPNSEEKVIFTVNSGESTMDTLNSLYEKKLIKSVNTAYEIMIDNEYAFYINSYEVSYSQSTKEILEVLNSPTSNVVLDEKNSLTIIEGADITQVAESISAISGITENDIIEHWANKDFLNELISKYWFITDEILELDIKYPLEGYFAPARYYYTEGDTIEDITYQILDNMANTVSKYEKLEFPNGYTFHEILTLASIIERETIYENDKYNVSGVFYNRLNQDMMLQSDITVLYALGEHKVHVLYEDLEVDSPYNTYKNVGLTPGPIASPSASSIDAAINPTKNEYLFFFALQESGETLYTKTYEEHLKVVEENAWE